MNYQVIQQPGALLFLLGMEATRSSLGLLPPPLSLTSVPLITTPASSSIVARPSLPVALSQPPASTVAWPSPPATLAQPPVDLVATLSGFSLSPATEPIPQKLVDKIRSGQFVEMRDLLTDNISLMQQLESFSGQYSLPSLPGVLRPRMREVTSLASWMYCFLAYVAIRSVDPTTRDMLAYARLIIREAQRHGGSGWRDYDRVFRQQAAIDHSIQWNTLHPGIQAATLVGRGLGASILCTLCREPDHTADHCALSYLHQPLASAHTVPLGTAGNPVVTRSRPHPGRRSESMLGICISWNKGRCVYPGTCTYRHVCATCQQLHMARDCMETPVDSEYKRHAQSGSQTTQRLPKAKSQGSFRN